MPDENNVIPLRKELGDDEIRAILEDIARKGTPSVKIQALRLLLQMRKDDPLPPSDNPFADLDVPRKPKAS